MDKQYILDNTVYLIKHGSHAYGLNIPSSDLDIKGVVCVGPGYYLTSKKFEQSEDFEDDQVRYNLTKFIKLASACNPNIIEMLFVDDSDILEMTSIGSALREHRQKFVSLAAHRTFCGYAVSQLKRMKSKHRWITNPPSKKPEQKDFCHVPKTETEMSLFPKDTLVYDKTAYLQALNDWKSYQAWLTSSTSVRKQSEIAFGFRSKHAMHLVRLLKMGREILTTGDVIVKRPDRDELLAVRAGEWDYNDLVTWAEDQLNFINKLAEKYKNGEAKSPIPKHVDIKFIDKLTMHLIQEHWRGKGWLSGFLTKM